jgi:hypothetical protein
MRGFQNRSDFIARSAGSGGGSPPLPAAPLDPNGLVPVNRAQPLATDGGEAQRLMERRLGSMPPSSFAGAGAGFVPLNRPMVRSFADRRTDMARAEMANNPGINQGPPISGESARRAALAYNLTQRSGLLGL